MNFSWLNCFGILKETDKSPYARTLRTGFFDKVKDAFFIYSGPIDFTDDCRYSGIFDYATLFIFLGLIKLYQRLNKHLEDDDPFKWLGLFIIFFPLIAASVIRVGLAIVMTLITSPFILLANLYIDYSDKWHANRYKQAALSIIGTEHSYKSTQTQLSLGEFLQRHRLSLEDLKMRPYEASYTTRVANAAQTVGNAIGGVATGIGSLFGYNNGRGSSKPKKRERKRIATLSLFYKHPPETSCLPSFRPNLNELFCFYCLCPNQALFQGGKYATQRIEELVTYAAQGEKQDEFLIPIYEDNEDQLEELDALFRLNVGQALLNTHLDIRLGKPSTVSPDESSEKENPPRTSAPQLFQLHPSE